MAKKTCFVSMGFGKKTDYYTGRSLDLDKTYRNIIKPAATEAGLEEPQPTPSSRALIARHQPVPSEILRVIALPSLTAKLALVHGHRLAG